MAPLSTEDIAAMRKQGDLGDYLRSVIAAVPAPAKPEPAATPEPADPGYALAHRGGWPIGTAATGPTPTHGRCSCIRCEQAAVVQLPTTQHRDDTEEAA
ncbi:hypothetical protein [Streptomyces sp. NPDC059786]|uniref:hypothetical protein n=1 Tax=Streptomyces sp. NPDC059786 TaxID=3346946 RepID=UPI003659C144